MNKYDNRTNSAKGSATSAQENRNRYNERLNKVLQNISNTKETTTDTAPAPSKTRRTKATTPKALGNKIYKLYPRVDGAKTRNGVMCQDIIYHDPAGYAVVTDNKTVTASKLDYQEDHKGKAITVNGDEHPFGEALKTYRTLLPVSDEVYTIDLNSIKKSVQACKARGEYYTVLRYPDGTMQVTHTDRLLNALQIASKLQATKLTSDDAKIQLSSDYGLVLMACPKFSNREEDYHDGTEPHDPALDIKTIIDLTDVITATEDTTPDKPETTQTDKSETTVHESEQEVTEEGTDASFLRFCVEHYGAIGADYLDTLDYSKATKQEPRTVMFGRAEVTEKYYTIDVPTQIGNPQTYGLSRLYNRNGKRAMFAVCKDGLAIELRWYGKNNNTYITEVRFDGGVLGYNVTDGLVTRAELNRGDNTISVEFDDANRPETPRDLPAPATTKPTKPTSKTAPTSEILQPETTTATEVTTANTDQQWNDPAPYWLLLDNELKAQQEEQEQALATPEKSEELSKKLSDELATIISKRSNTAPEEEGIEYNANLKQTTIGSDEWREEMEATHDFEFEGCFSINGRIYYSIVFCQEPVDLKGRGVKRLNDYEYTLTERAFHKVCEEYTYFSDHNY